MKNFLREKFNTEAVTSWAWQIDIINKCLSIPGLTGPKSLSENVHSKLSYYVRFVIIFLWPVFSFYSALNASNSSDCLEATLLTIASIHAVSKFVFLWLLKENRIKLLDTIVHTTTSSRENNDSYRILSSKILAVTIIIYVIAACAFFTMPLLHFDHLKLPLQMRIIGTSPKSHPGYEINYVYQILQFYFSLATTIGFNLVFYLCCFFTVSRFDLCKKYSTFIGDKTGRYNTEDKQKEMLHLLIDIHTNAIHFLDKFKAHFQSFVLTHILTLMGIVCISIIQTLTGNRVFFSLTIVTVVLVELLIYSIFGEIIASKCQEFAEEIYSSNWYELKDIENRKMVLLILLNAQKCEGFLIKGFFKLCLAKFAEVLKACYIFIAFLNNIL